MHKLLIPFFLIVSLDAFSATTATLQLRGVVPPILSIEVTPETIATSLPLNATQNNTKVATVIERSNNHAGYKVKITSSNLGRLVNNSTNFINYVLTYNNQTISLGSASGSTFNNVFTNAAPVQKDIKISYSAVDENATAAGDYTDTVTFTITAN